MRIKEVEVGNILLAPMAGVTEVGFRKASKLGGADFTYTEMVNSKALRYNNAKTKNLLLTSELETPCALQIFGSDATDMARVCQSELAKKFDIIDINFGCPAPKIVKNGEGSALLNDFAKMQNIITSCVKATNKPITAKIRIGFNNEHNVALSVAKLCEDCGASAITVHGRTRQQMYSGEVDLETIAKVKSCVNIPVIGNGDVTGQDSYQKMLQTGVDAVMIGRGALGKPWIFNDIKNIKTPDKFNLILQHVNELKKYYNEKWITTNMRKHFLWYAKDFVGVGKIRLKLATCDNINEALNILEELYNKGE